MIEQKDFISIFVDITGDQPIMLFTNDQTPTTKTHFMTIKTISLLII